MSSVTRRLGVNSVGRVTPQGRQGKKGRRVNDRCKSAIVVNASIESVGLKKFKASRSRWGGKKTGKGEEIA